MTEVVLATLANSVWVGTVAAAFVRLACLALRDASARHWVCFWALAATLLVPVAQTLVPEPPPPPASEWSAALTLVSDAWAAPAAPARDWSPLAWGWATGAGLLFALLLVRLGRALRAKRSAVWVSARLLERREVWRSELAPGRDGDFLESPAARSPFAVGWFRPAVVFLTRMEDRLADGDLKRLWLHEAAHLRRYDDWSALVSEFLGTVLFFHPAVWWLRSRMAAEREFACDEAAARAAGSAADYALTLTRFAELQLPQNLAGELGFAGGPGLSRRIKMLIDPSRKNGSKRSRWAFGLAGAALTVAMVAGPKVTLAQQESPVAVDVKPEIEVEISPQPSPSPSPSPRPTPHPAVSVPPVLTVPRVQPKIAEPTAPPAPFVAPAPEVPSVPSVPPKMMAQAAQAVPNKERLHEIREQAREMAERARRARPDPEQMRLMREKARKMAEVARQYRPDPDQMRLMREQTRKMAEEMKRNLPDQEQLRRIQEQARTMAEQARLAAPDPEQIRLLEERARLMAEQARLSMPDEATIRRIEEQAERMSLHAERMQERMAGLQEEMERLHEEMRPALEELERNFKEQAETEPFSPAAPAAPPLPFF